MKRSALYVSAVLGLLWYVFAAEALTRWRGGYLDGLMPMIFGIFVLFVISIRLIPDLKKKGRWFDWLIWLFFIAVPGFIGIAPAAFLCISYAVLAWTPH